MTTQPLIFLSYAREDEAEVSSLYHTLAAAGFNPWLDQKNILPGENWQQAIDRALRQANTVLICLSSSSVRKRGWVQREIKRARELAEGMLDDDIFLIPVRLEPCDLPESLEEFQWVDLFEADGESRLLHAIRTGLERQDIVIDPPPRPAINPFFVGGRINDPRHFFGRKRLIREIRAELKKRVSVSLVGESQIGKTSLLYYLYATRADWLPDVTIEFVDLQMVWNEADFYSVVLEKLGAVGDSHSRLRQALIGRDVILLLDEVEQLADSDFNPKLQGLLRALAQEPTFALCVATHRELGQVFPPVARTSPLANIFTVKTLGPFTQAEARNFLATRLDGTGVAFAKAEIDRLVADSQGHPAELQRRARALFEEKVS